MSYVVHTEALNLVAAVAEEESHHLTDTLLPNSQSGRLIELKLLHELAIPTLIIELGLTVPNFLTASYIGRNFSIMHLDGFTLASLTTNLCTLSLLSGLYTASDTLSPQAYAAGNKAEVGYLAIRGFISSVLIVLPILIVLLLFMDRILVCVGEDVHASTLAAKYFTVYILGLPAYSLYQATWKFLSAQDVMFPLVAVVLFSCVLVLPTALYVFGSLFGYMGTAWAIVLFHFCEAGSLILYLYWFQPHDAGTWKGLVQSSKQALQWKPTLTFIALGAGGMLASSEWIYWETLSLIIGTFGVLPLSVHTIPTQVITVFFMGPMSFGIALAIRVGATLPQSVARAKQNVKDCMLFVSLVFGIVSLAMYIGRRSIIGLFTNNDDVVDKAEEIWVNVCIYQLMLAQFAVLMGACIGLGMQWRLGFTTLAVLWGVGLPVAYFVSVVLGGGLRAAWFAIWPPYILINSCLALSIIRADWDAIAEDIRIRECATAIKHIDETIKLPIEQHDRGAANTQYGSTGQS